MVDLDELERLHKAAKPFKWEPIDCDGYSEDDVNNSIFIAAIKNACDDGLLERLREAERMSDLGCDAADGGPHTVIVQGKYNFCGKCGVTVKRPTLSERARAAEARVKAAETSLAALKAENERLREALAPFKRVADMEERVEPLDSVFVNITHCRAARTALEAPNG